MPSRFWRGLNRQAVAPALAGSRRHHWFGHGPGAARGCRRGPVSPDARLNSLPPVLSSFLYRHIPPAQVRLVKCPYIIGVVYMVCCLAVVS